MMILTEKELPLQGILSDVKTTDIQNSLKSGFVLDLIVGHPIEESGN